MTTAMTPPMRVMLAPLTSSEARRLAARPRLRRRSWCTGREYPSGPASSS